MMTYDDKVGGWVKKGQNHDDVILEWSITQKRPVGAEKIDFRMLLFEII